MVRILSALAFVLLALHAFADDLNETLGGGSKEFEYVRYTDEYIQLKIHEAAMVNCHKSLCTLFAQTTRHHDFSLEFSVGESANGGSGSTSGGSGSIIVVPTNNTASNTVRPYIGLVARYSIGKCTQKIKVPESLYISMNTFLYNLINEDGTPQRGFTPADEAMIMFYSTIMKQASSCTSGKP